MSAAVSRSENPKRCTKTCLMCVWPRSASGWPHPSPRQLARSRRPLRNSTGGPPDDWIATLEAKAQTSARERTLAAAATMGERRSIASCKPALEEWAKSTQPFAPPLRPPASWKARRTKSPSRSALTRGLLGKRASMDCTAWTMTSSSLPDITPEVGAEVGEGVGADVGTSRPPALRRRCPLAWHRPRQPLLSNRRPIPSRARCSRAATSTAVRCN
mmetsp:Transcript_113262/g.231815  ORF Transcript_113262/g.231815 Transcript_113262/m.231815 type:complete len:216 (-) Transcript_113262:43-690(-)